MPAKKKPTRSKRTSLTKKKIKAPSKKSTKTIIPKKATKKITAARKKLKANLASTKKKILSAEKKLLKYVKDNPEKAVAVSAALGAVIGVTLAKKIKSLSKKK